LRPHAELSYSLQALSGGLAELEEKLTVSLGQFSAVLERFRAVRRWSEPL
jgi:hypothetical protein